MADIFLSYRRQDSQSATGRLADRLEEHFGAARVFRDHDSIAVGEDFVETIRRGVEASTVLLVIVGPRWLAAVDAAGRRRLDDPHDFVRLEIELAVRADVAVVPVLVEDATMPEAADLPPTLAEFARCQAAELSETRWRYDADRLIATLQSRFAIESDAPPLPTPGDRGSGALARLANDLLDLATHPTRLISRRHTGRASDHVRAFAFLTTAILAGNLALLVGLDVHVARGASFALAASALLGWLLVGELVGLILACLLAVALALGWRLAGGREALRRVGPVAGYVYGGTWMGFCAGALLLGTGMQLLDPGLLDRIFAAVSAAASGNAPGNWPEVRATGSGTPFRGAAAVLVLLSAVVWLVTTGWCFAAWGAFRQAFAATRLQSIAATSVWIAVLAAFAWAGSRLG
jgi:hypothetical protein